MSRWPATLPPPADVLSAWTWPGPVRAEPVTSGLINTTWIVAVDGADTPAAVLQRLNTDIFDPAVHHDTHGLGRLLRARGVGAPALWATRHGDLFLDRPDGAWRVMEFVGDRTVDRLTDPADARSAGALVARFHAALDGVDWDFHFTRTPDPHDTDAHLRALRKAVDTLSSHRLHAEVAPLADALQTRWEAVKAAIPAGLPSRILHGDLKISNLRFEDGEAVALIDLDTLQRGTLDVEMGDALRSWCASGTEDDAALTVDEALLEASLTGYARGGRDWSPTEAEWAALVPGLARISTELAARFAADALHEDYFGWDRTRFDTAGDHHLLRARGQVALSDDVWSRREALEAVVAQARAAADGA